MAQFALENTPMQVFWIDESGCFVEANPAACQALGYSHEELLALRVSDLDINIPAKQWGSFFRELRSAGKRIYETQCRQKSGALIDVEITLSLFEQEGQEFVCALAHDIGKRKRAESELKRASRRMSVAANSASIGIWEWDLISNELIWDSRMFCLYGIEPESFTGAYEAWEQGLHPDDRDRMNGEVEVALRGEKEFDSEFRIITPAGEVRYIKANSEVIRDESGQPVRMIGVNFDITEQRSLYERAEMLQRLADHSDLGIGWAGMDTRARYINPTMKRMLGVAEDEDASKFAFTDFYTEDQLKRLQECVLPDVMSQGRWIGELEVKSLDGMITPTVHNVFCSRIPRANLLPLPMCLSTSPRRNRLKRSCVILMSSLRTRLRRAPQI
ncbi:PAS domain S-box protein [Candidatus Reidiella endopervernicosa]|uniref:histidine kinase n=1 Tax=Candidatus Reidiella endopervernicosa TaxID=2738883 RepID=A0A6N0HVP8_9GAMM|nr:PAS domain S-box protein [Candidatus Reidiella endopervernicosa]QKQ26428.1 PAS domain S-box protein [Candidatus Reidiella endopervernicosa]